MTREDTTNSRRQKLEDEFKELLNFHNKGFEDIDRKAQYWLTISLPAFIALCGIIMESDRALSIPFLAASSALVLCLLVAIYFLSSAIHAKLILSGRLRVKADETDIVEKSISTSRDWQLVRRRQTEELLKAIENNEEANKLKSTALKRGETLLFVSCPTAVLLAGCAAFGYTAANPLHGTGATATGVIASAVAIGVTAGLAAIAATFGVRHR